MTILKEEDRYRILKLLADNPTLNQRQMAEALSVSLGRVNCWVKYLAERGWLEWRSEAGGRGSYLLTPAGKQEKRAVRQQCLAKKQRDYARLRMEIEQLKQERH